MTTNDISRDTIRYPKPDDQDKRDEESDSLVELYKQNFYPGALDYMPVENLDELALCDLEDEKCIEDVNEFVNQPENLTELCDLEDKECVEEINEFMATPANMMEQEGEGDVLI